MPITAVSVACPVLVSKVECHLRRKSPWCIPPYVNRFFFSILRYSGLWIKWLYHLYNDFLCIFPLNPVYIYIGKSLLGSRSHFDILNAASSVFLQKKIIKKNRQKKYYK